jgi:hypothetical protein
VIGRRGKDYYKLADQWLRNEVEAARVGQADPRRASELLEAAQHARSAMRKWDAA